MKIRKYENTKILVAAFCLNTATDRLFSYFRIFVFSYFPRRVAQASACGVPRASARVRAFSYFRIFVFSYFCVANISASAATATIDSSRIVVGEQTALHIAAQVRKGQRVRFAPYKDGAHLTPGVEIVGTPTCDTTEADGTLTITTHLTLTAFEDSLYAIPAQRVLVDGKQQQTLPLTLRVLTIPVDTVHTNKYFGPRDVQDPPFQWGEWARLLWLTALTVALYALCWLAFLRVRSKKPIKLRVRIVKRVPPHQRALGEIDKIKTTASTVDPKAYYTSLTDTLRRYMQARFGFNAMEMTSDEIITRLQQEDDKEKLAELTALFQTADLVKFAKHTVDLSENDRNLVSAVGFINATKQDNQPTEERIEPTITEQQRQTIRLRRTLKIALALLVIAATALLAYTLWGLYDLRW